MNIHVPGFHTQLIREIEKKNSWGKNELISLIVKLQAYALDMQSKVAEQEGESHE